MHTFPMPLLLALILALAAAMDLLRRKVYNWLTFPAMALGLILNTAVSHWSGLGFGVLGLVAGGLIFLPAYLWGGMGEGDIKLMAVVGAFQGWVFAMNTALYTALAGGVVAIVVLLIRGELGKTLAHLGRVLISRCRGDSRPEPLARTGSLPYAAVIAAGAAAAYFLPPLLAWP